MPQLRRDRKKAIRINAYMFLRMYETNLPSLPQWHFWLVDGMPPIRKRIKNGNDLFQIYNRIHPKVFQNLDEAFDVKHDGNYITYFSNPVKFV